MMKHLVIAFAIFLSTAPMSFGQNIINNPSFEDGGIPNHLIPEAMIANATGWMTSPTACSLDPGPLMPGYPAGFPNGTPDLLDPGAHCYISAPSNRFCIDRDADEGVRYVHISGYQEQVMTFLLEPLVANCEYEISLNASNVGPTHLGYDCVPVTDPVSTIDKRVQVVLRSTSVGMCDSELIIFETGMISGNCVDPWLNFTGYYTFTDAEIMFGYDVIEFRVAPRYGGLSGGLIYGGSVLLDNVSLEKNLPEVSVLSSDSSPCSSTGTYLSVSPAGSYDNCQWFDQDGVLIGSGDGIMVFETGVYSVNCWNGTGQFDESCGVSASIQVFVTESPEVDLGDNITVCFGDDNPLLSSSFLYSGDVSYEWSTPGGWIAISPTLVASEEGLYCLTVTNDETGCEGSHCVYVTFPPEIDAVGGAFYGCIGEDLDLCVTTPSGVTYGYYWFGSATPVTTPCFTVTPTTELGTLTFVTVEDLFGCTKTVNITYEGLPIPDIDILDFPETCACEEVVLTAVSSSSGEISWSGTVSPSITVSPCLPTSYAATIVDDNGCTNTAFVSVAPKPVPVTFFTEAKFCDNAGEIPFFNYVGPLGDPAFSVSGETSAADLALNSTFDGLTTTYTFNPSLVDAGVYVINVCGVDANLSCCTTVTITVCPSPDFDFPDFCINDAPYYLLGPLPVGVVSVSTYGDDLGFAPDLSYNPSDAGAGTHYFDLCFEFAGGVQCCTSYAVNVFDAPEIETTLDTVLCLGDTPFGFPIGYDFTSSGTYLSDYFTPYTGADPSDPSTGFFTPASYISEVAASAVTFYVFNGSGLGEGVYPITYNITNQNGCADSAIGIVTICSPPDFDLTWDGCTGLSADVHASTSSCGAPYTYYWSGPGITSVGFTSIELNAIGLYTCTVTNAGGCSTTQTFGVKCDPPKIKITNNTHCSLPATLVASVTSFCPIVSYSWVGPGGVIIGTEPELVATVEGLYTFTAVDALGCSTTVTYLLEAPELIPVFDPTAPISLCSDPDLIPITYNSDGTDCELTSISLAFDPIAETFDPVFAGAGTYEIIINCFEGNCTGSDTLEIVVLDDLFWHQTTQMAQEYDVYKDVITDAAGNVYVTGSFVNNTQLVDDLTGFPFNLSTATINMRAAFIAKYDKCGSLLWVSQEEGLGAMETSEGVGIVLDELNGHVYVAGNFSQQMRLFDAQVNPVLGVSPCAGSAGTPLIGMGSSGFVARLSMDYGCVDLLGAVDPAPQTQLTSICINENFSVSQADVYVGGMVNPFPGPGPMNGTQSFARRYDINPSSSILPIENWSIMMTGSPSSYQELNEVDYDENLNKLWMIGNYKRLISFSHGGPTFGAAPQGKAFVAGYDVTIPAPNYYWARRSVNTGNRRTSGDGISVDELTGNVFITGSYSRSHNNAFGFPAADWTNGNNFNAYHLGFTSYPVGDPTLLWSRETEAGTGFQDNAYGQDVSFINGEAHFVGHYTNDLIIENPATSGDISVLYTTAPYFNGEHIFTVTYDDVFGNATEVNATDDMIGASDHVPNAITANANGKSFVVGRYSGQMNYQLGVPWSGPLVSSVDLFDYNAFVMRVDRAAGGSYRSQEVTEEDTPSVKEELNTIQITENDLEVSVYPNPTNGELKVNVIGFDSGAEYRVELRSITGQLIWSESLNNSQSNFDLSELENGMYLISISNGDQFITKRIVKQ